METGTKGQNEYIKVKCGNCLAKIDPVTINTAMALAITISASNSCSSEPVAVKCRGSER